MGAVQLEIARAEGGIFRRQAREGGIYRCDLGAGGGQWRHFGDTKVDQVSEELQVSGIYTTQ